MKCLFATMIASCCLLLMACTDLPSLDQSLSEYSTSQKRAAQEAEQEEQFALALSLWRSQLPINDADPEIHSAIERLQRKIQRLSEDAFRSGKAAYLAGDARAGDTSMLKILALQPGHEQALALLRKSTSKQAQAEQAAKLLDRNIVIPPHPDPKPPSVVPGIRELFESENYHEVISLVLNSPRNLASEDAYLVRGSYLALADAAAMQGDRLLELEYLEAAVLTLSKNPDPLSRRITGLKADLSEDWYRRGSSLINLDLGGAISALEKSIDYNPKNTKAKLKLRQAKTLRRNLQKIQDR